MWRQVCWKGIGDAWHTREVVCGDASLGQLAGADILAARGGAIWLAAWGPGARGITVQQLQGNPMAATQGKSFFYSCAQLGGLPPIT